MQNSLDDLGRRYGEDGFINGIDIISDEAARKHRQILENAENQIGALHYKPKIHTLLMSPYELATLPAVLDVVERCIGPDILLFNITYIIKEPQTRSHVSWHQDLTYWGLSDDTQVTMWLALSPATAESGCMRMLPGSHKFGKLEHKVTDDQNNVLLQGQTIEGVDESSAVLCPLKPGQASFHHGWTMHASLPNTSEDRRIGLNVQYIAPHVRQIKHDLDSAILVRGVDEYHHFAVDEVAVSDLDPVAVARHVELQRLYEATAGRA
jgi:ectoine hydroxylase-related dioxygenase (phytanoyl-CoA dioxygenase family)